MKKQKLTSAIAFLVVSFGLFFCETAFAFPNVVVTQSSPKTYDPNDVSSLYGSGENVYFSGTWSLPQNYFAKLKYTVDGVLLSSDTIDSFGAGGTVSGNYSFNAGIQAQGTHRAQIQVLVESKCSIEGTCVRDVTAQTANYLDYKVLPSDKPYLHVTPSVMPAFKTPSGTSITQNFSVNNVGGVSMNYSVSKSGDGSFACVSGCSGSVAAGGYKNVAIRYNAPDNSVHSANIGFYCSNCSPVMTITKTVTSSTAVYSVGVKGASTKPEVWILSGLTTDWYYVYAPLSLNWGLPGTLDFGVVPVGKSKDMEIYVSNFSGTLGGDLSGTVTFSPTGQFSCVYPSPCNYSNLAYGENQRVVIRFTPTSAGVKSSVATFSNTVNPVNGTGSLTFSASAVAAPYLEVTATPPADSSCSPGNINPSTCNLTENNTSVSVGNSKYISFYVRNLGTGSLSGGLTITSPGGDFTCATVPCTYSGLLYDSTGAVFKKIDVKFAPKTAAAGGKCTDPYTPCASTLTFALGTVTRSFSVLANGNEGKPWLTVTPLGDTNYGSVDVVPPVGSPGSYKDLVFEIKNSGAGSQKLNGSVDVADPFSCSDCNYSLNSGDTKNITVRFSPSFDGDVTRTAIFSGAQDSSEMVSGYGNMVRNASILLNGSAATSYNYGVMNIGDTPRTKSFVLKNTGLGDWKGEVSVAAPFECSPQDAKGRCIYTVSAGESVPVDITFKPTTEGYYVSDAGFSGRTNPSAYYPFDSEDHLPNVPPSTNYVSRDASGHKLDVALSGSATITPVGEGLSGEALSFPVNLFGEASVRDLNAADPGYVSVLPSGSIMSVSMWVKPAGVYLGMGNINPLIYWQGDNIGCDGTGTGSGFLLSMSPDTLQPTFGHLGFYSWSNNIVPPSLPKISPNTWSHVVAVLNGKDITLYVNGMTRTDTLRCAPIISKKATLHLGAQGPGIQRNFWGLEDEVEIFDRALTVGEIARLSLASDKSTTFDNSVLAKIRRLAASDVFADTVKPDKISISLSGGFTPVPLINIDIGAFNFGRVRVNKSKEQTFKFTNNGGGVLGPGSLSIPAPFKCVQTISDTGTIDPACSYSVSAGSFFSAVIRFTPIAKVKYEENLSFSVPFGLISVPLKGEGVSTAGGGYTEF